MLPHTEKSYQHYGTGYQKTIKMHQQKRSIRDFYEEKQKEYLPKTAHVSR